MKGCVLSAVLLGLLSWNVVEWVMQSRNRVDLPLKALGVACLICLSPSGLIHYTVRGNDM